jgi:hypothetical protein
VTLRGSLQRPAVWWWITALAAVIFFYLATSDAVYDLTSPVGLDVHVLLRKAYSLIAFAVIGYCAARATRLGSSTVAAWRIGAYVAAFSAAIEVAQSLTPPSEGLLSNSFDVVCGFVGGWLGALFVRL